VGTRIRIEKTTELLTKRLLLVAACVGLLTVSASDTLAASQVKRIQFLSEAVAMKRDVHVYLPAQYTKDKKARFPVVYALHGLGGNGGDFFELGKFKSHLDVLIRSQKLRPVIVVAPDGSKGYWANQPRIKGKRSERWADYVSKDLVGEIDSRFRTQPTREGRALVGLSMGGFGALSIGLQHPDKFHALISLSGAIFPTPPGCKGGGLDCSGKRCVRVPQDCSGKVKRIGKRAHYRNAWGYPPRMAHWKRLSPMDLLEALKSEDAQAPRVYLHCGTGDRRFHPFSEQAHKILENKKGIDNIFRSVKGAKHNWKAWEPETPRWLTWLEAGWVRLNKVPALPSTPKAATPTKNN